MSDLPAAVHGAATDTATTGMVGESAVATRPLASPEATINAISEASCPRCDSPFICGASSASCWCQALPALDIERLPPSLIGGGCLCGDCLGVVVAEQLAA